MNNEGLVIDFIIEMHGKSRKTGGLVLQYINPWVILYSVHNQSVNNYVLQLYKV